MRVAFLVGYFPVISETFVLNQITGLIDRGHEVDIYALDGIRNNVKVHPDVEKYRLLDRTYAPVEVRQNRYLKLLQGLKLLLIRCAGEPLTLVRLLKIIRYSQQRLSLSYIIQLLSLAILLVDQQPYDITHCQFGTFGLKGLHLRDLGAISGKFITSFRGYDISLYVQQNGDRVYDRLFATGDFFLANCDFFRHKAIALGCQPDKIAVLRSGIDCQRFFFAPRYLQPDDKVRIVTVGRLVEKKGIEYGIRAVAKLAKVHQNIEYQIVGDGGLRDSLQHLIQELEVGHLIKLLGAKQQQEIIQILDHSHIFIAPSVTGKSGDQDAPVNTAKEAMAMGLPVIGTLHGGIPELVEDGISGFLVPERDADALAAKLCYLVEHPEVWSKMGKAGRIYVEQLYDTHQLNDQLIKIYEQLIVDVQPHQPANVAEKSLVS